MENTIKIYVSNLGKYNEGELVGKWVTLPIYKDEWQQIKKDILIDDVRYEEIAIHDYECSFMKIGEYDSIQWLNEIAEKIENLNEYDTNKFKAILENNYYIDIISAIDDLDNFILLENINSFDDLGYYCVMEAGYLNIPDEIIGYFDFEKYGKDISLEADGWFSDYGWIEYMN